MNLWNVVYKAVIELVEESLEKVKSR